MACQTIHRHLDRLVSERTGMFELHGDKPAAHVTTHKLLLVASDAVADVCSSLTQIWPGSLVRGHPACWVVEVRNLPVAVKLVGVFNGFNRCAAGF
jgi:hypothetical protein